MAVGENRGRNGLISEESEESEPRKLRMPFLFAILAIHTGSMATLDSSSTTAQITAAYLDNCGYIEDASATMARAFITACMAMLARGIRVIDHAGERLEFSPAELRALIADARKYIAETTGDAGGVKFASFENFRS